MGDEQRTESGGGGVDSAFGEQALEFLQGAVDAHAGRVFGGADCFTDNTEFAVLEEAKDESEPIGLVEFVHGGVEDGCELEPVGFGFGGVGRESLE